MTTPLVHYVPLPLGRDGDTMATLVVMASLVRQAAGDREAGALAHELVPVFGLDTDEQIAAVWEFLEARFLFAYDPAPMDRVANPTFLLQEVVSKGVVRGDCDDAAVLAAFFAEVFGIPWKFRAVGFRTNGPLSHVFTLLRGSRGDVSLDVTRNRSQVVPAARRVLDYP